MHFTALVAISVLHTNGSHFTTRKLVPKHAGSAHPILNLEYMWNKFASVNVFVLLLLSVVLISFPDLRNPVSRGALSTSSLILVGHTFWRLFQSGVLTMTVQQIHKMPNKPLIRPLEVAAGLASAIAVTIVSL
jgi:hypothetical protein